MSSYKRHRFPPDIISYAVWLYYRFNLSHRRFAGPFIEILLAERGIIVSREAIRLWCIKFGTLFARRLKRKHRGYSDTFFIDEVCVSISGKQHYLWRAVDQDGEIVDVYLQPRRNGATAKRFFKRLLRSHGDEPRKIVSDKLRSYCVAHRELIPDTIHVKHSTPTIGQSKLRRRQERGSGVCGSSNPDPRLKVLLRPMPQYRIYSTWVGTWSVLKTIGASGQVRSKIGIK